MPGRSDPPQPVRRRLHVLLSHQLWAHYRSAVMRELAEHGAHDYTFIGDPRDPAGTIRGADVEAYAAAGRFVHAPLVSLAGGRFVWQRGMIRASLRRDVDVVIFIGHYGHLSTWIAATLARLFGKRVLFWTHGYTREDRGVRRLIRKLFYSIPHALMFYGHHGKSYAVKRVGFAPESIHVLYNSLDLTAQRDAMTSVTRASLASLRAEFFGDADVPVIVCVIRLLASRRLDLVIEAVARLGESGHRVNVLIVGDGPERANLERQARDRGVRLHLYGACYDEATLARLTMLANATVCAGAVGLTVIQSLAYGTPVISNGNWVGQGPEFEAILSGRTGDYFESGDIDSLAEAIRRWTKQPWPAPAVAADCRSIVERVWNPRTQRRVIDRAVSGLPADDLFWMHEDQVAGKPSASS